VDGLPADFARSDAAGGRFVVGDSGRVVVSPGATVLALASCTASTVLGFIGLRELVFFT